MKPVFKTPLLVASLMLALVGCNEQQANAVEPGAAKDENPTRAISEANKVELTAFESKAAYAIGHSTGNFIRQNWLAQQELGIKLDKSIMSKGISDGLEDLKQMSDEELKATLDEYQDSVNTLLEAKTKKDGEKNLELSKEFLAKNAKEADVKRLDSGLQYKVVKLGKGQKPKETDTVKVHYEGRLVNGTVFDSSYKRGEPIIFPLNEVIQGWIEGVQLMPVGSKFTLFIPAELAYGENDSGPIPGNSALIFDIELLGIEAKK